ncbi:MAG: hypothetical protein ACOY9D_06195 [Pseudomonadota bacterium]
MPNATVLGSIMWEVIKAGTERTLDDDERKKFYTNFQSEVSEKIEEIRTEQRRAHEESKNLILS